jgi:3-oxoacyl-[acyl-carrier protein] reductase
MERPQDSLAGRTALVTGGSRGIGRAVAVRLARAGAAVAVNFRFRAAEAAAVCEEIGALGGAAVAVAADVTDSGQIAAMVDTVRSRLGTISILVNNAGITRPQRLEEITEQSWNEVLAANLSSVFLVTQAVLPAMRAAGWGRIINLSSVAAQTGGVVGPHYAASKAGILGLTHSYASLLAQEGITVNAIAPALIDTEMVRSNPRASPQLIPVGRFGTVDEIADVACLLAANGYITGQTISVNGGWYMT